MTLSPGDYANGNLTAKPLPASLLAAMDFSNERAVVLIDNVGNELLCSQVPLEARQGYFNIFGRYFLDLFNGHDYLLRTGADDLYRGFDF